MKKEKFSFKDDFAYCEFFDLNRHWLAPYAAFCYLRDKYSTADFNNWEDYKKYDEDTIQQLVSPDNDHYDDIAIHYFIQYHLHLQLTEAVEYAHKNKIILKGDLPIGMGRYSVDTWMNPELFNMDMQTGAPPDAFAINGQNWDFPTYNWKKMEEDNYRWWRQRMEHISHYFDAIRIDHVLGFFRIWSIPVSVSKSILGKFVPAIPFSINDFENAGIKFDEDRFCNPFSFGESTDVLLLKDSTTEVHIGERRVKTGTQFHFRINMQQTFSFKNLPADQQEKLNKLYHQYFYQTQNELWKNEGIKKLMALKNTSNMLICAEDLGMSPEFVPDVLKELEILSLRVLRMPKKREEMFLQSADAPYLSVVTPSTHDMSTIREWWQEDKQAIQYFYNHLMGHYGPAPYFCEPWICKEIIQQDLNSPAMWSIFLLQDLVGIDEKLRRENPADERINIPADASHSWNYRMHISLEDLIKEQGFNEEVKLMIKESGR